MATEILLDAGSNEMELLIFRVGETAYGINVAKVKELIQQVETRPIPGAPEVVEGSFILRNEVLTLVDLAKYLECDSKSEEKQDKLIIVMEFSKIRTGVLVDAVEGIQRMSWDQIEPPSEFITQLGTPVTSVTKIDGRVILILDFEGIMGELFGMDGADAAEAENLPKVASHADIQVLAAEDSPIIRQGLERILRGAGFENVTICSNGEQAWNTLEKRFTEGGALFDIVLTDIEMPRMDGLHLTKKIKEHPDMGHIPVVLFSSIIREDTVNKGNTVGADAQVTKFDVEELVGAIDSCLAKAAAKG